MNNLRKFFGRYTSSLRLISILTCIFFYSSLISPIPSHAASIENLDEMMARKARYATNPWPTSQLEDLNNNYTWQPETLCYTDVTTGREVWILVHGPDNSDIYSKEHGTNAWSYDGARIGFFSINRPTKNPILSRNDYHYRWVVNTDGSKLRCVEGYGRRDIPFDGFSWAHTENAYYSFGSASPEATGSEYYKLFKMTLDNNNVVTGSLVLNTSSVNTYKKSMVKGGISTNDSYAVFRDNDLRVMKTPNPIATTEVYFAKLGLNPTINYHWGVARHIGPSTNNWADPYGNHLSSLETHFHDVWSPGPTGSFIIGQYSGTAVFNLFKNHGSASDGGPLWQDWNGSSFGNNEIKVISNGAGTPNNPYGNPYFGHPSWDRWGRYGVVGTYTDNPKPGTRIYDIENNKLLPHYVFAYGKYDGQHHSWTGWTDYVIAVEPNWPTGNPTAYFIAANKWNSDYTQAFRVVNTHYQEQATGYNYNAYPRPSQSPDGTKVAFAQYFLNSSQSYPYIAWAVVYYPYPPINVRAQKNGNLVRLTWTRPSYTTRGWPNEATDPPPKAREIKGYHVWVSDNGVDGWTELTTTAVSTEYYDIAQANGTTKYYAVTSEEHSRLESRKLSEIRKVTLGSIGNLTDSQYAPEGKTGFWTTLPYAPSNFTVEKQSTAGQYLLRWLEPNDSKVRYYNIYYSTTGTPPADQQHRIASVPAGTSKYLDWLADRSLTGYYKITSVDRQGNEGTEPPSNPINITPPPTITPTPTPTPSPSPSPSPTPTPTPLSDTKGNKWGLWKKEPSPGGEVYLAVSQTNSDRGPIGNVKKFEVSIAANPVNSTNSSNPINPSVQVVDATGNPALDSGGLVSVAARSFWSSRTDGMQVNRGGVGEVLVSRSEPRHIFTYLGNPNLMSESNQFATSNEKITPELLGLAPGDAAGRDKLIQFIQGYDSYAINRGNTNLKKRDWLLGAIVNSRPLVIPYGDSRSVIFVGANDGMFHAFDNATGEELWGFIPDELLNRLRNLASGNKLEYFVDGSPKAYITGSQKIIVFGLRRGGSYYYALDVTDPDHPGFLWEIGPETTGFSEMGQTWSTPQIGKIKYGSGEKVVCFIGGGYDEKQDRKNPTFEDKKGRAVYIVDLFTGQQIWRWDHARDPNMKYSIPSDISCVDTNGDGYIDRLYVGDTGGRLWRFNISEPDPTAWSGSTLFNSSVGLLGGSRKIFSRPDVTLEKGFEMVFFGTGDREHPDESKVMNQIYAIKDKGLKSTLSEKDLENVTDGVNNPKGIEGKEGWFISLENRGEKALAPPVVLFGVAYFTTFTPSSGGAEGIARIYALNYKYGGPILDLNPENNTERIKIDLSDRSRVIGTGIPSGVIISAINGKLVAFTGFLGGVYYTPLRKNSTIIPIWWKEVSKK